MTDEQKYNELLKELAKVIHNKNETIEYNGYLIENLKHKIEIFENEIEELKKGK